MLTAKARRFRLKYSMQRSLSLCFIRNGSVLLIVIIAYSGISFTRLAIGLSNCGIFFSCCWLRLVVTILPSPFNLRFRWPLTQVILTNAISSLRLSIHVMVHPIKKWMVYGCPYIYICSCVMPILQVHPYSSQQDWQYSSCSTLKPSQHVHICTHVNAPT